MIFNNESKDYLTVTMELYRSPTPPIEFINRDLRSGGTEVKDKRFTDMTLSVPIVIRSDEAIEYLKEDLSNWLYHDKPKKLSFKQIPDRYYLAEYDSMELDEKAGYGKGVINFYLAQAYRYGQTKTLTVNPNSQSYEITGQKETSWKSVTIFKSSLKTFSIASNFGEIKINYSFVAGDVLRINYDKREITINGNNIDVGLSLNSQWFKLQPKIMSIKATSQTTIEYIEVFY